MSRFKYTVKAHPTMYDGVQYRSRLEARWAVFFDLAGWKHEYEPIDLPGWSPDFRVEFPCGHSEFLEAEGKAIKVISADASAAFGANPEVTYWSMSHGSGGGDECLMNWVPNYGQLWRKAGNVTQWKPRQ